MDEINLRGGSGGVKTTLLLLVASFLSLALSVPERPAGRVHDEAALLTSEQRQDLELKLSRFEVETTNQIVVATFPSLDNESLEDFSIRLAEKWKIGQEGKDNGIILLIFPNDRRLRIEVGYGLEAVVPDAYASRIIEEKLKPAFRQGDFHGGIDAAVDALIAATRGEYEAARQEPGGGDFGSLVWLVLFLFVPVLIFLAIFLAIVGSAFPHRRGVTWGGGGGHSSSGGGGGWSGGGGGFGGGGGSFGGGGSSGSW